MAAYILMRSWGSGNRFSTRFFDIKHCTTWAFGNGYRSLKARQEWRALTIEISSDYVIWIKHEIALGENSQLSRSSQTANDNGLGIQPGISIFQLQRHFALYSNIRRRVPETGKAKKMTFTRGGIALLHSILPRVAVASLQDCSHYRFLPSGNRPFPEIRERTITSHFLFSSAFSFNSPTATGSIKSLCASPLARASRDRILQRI